MSQGRRLVLVTGARRFIGSRLVERLVRQGDQVRALVHYNSRNDWGNLELIDAHVRRSVEVVTGDIADPFSVRNATKSTQVVCHFTAVVQ